MDAGRAGRRRRSRSRRRWFEIFRTGSESRDGGMMEGGVQMDLIDQEQPLGKGSRIFTILFLVVIVLVVLGALTLFQRRAQYQALAKETETLAIPTVAVFHAAVEATQEDLVLPGAMQPHVESPVYARTNGYLKKWYHDIAAPASGVITRRDVDTGTLINAGDGGAAQQTFDLEQTDPIRVYVSVPEAYAPSIRAGLGAFLELTQYPGQNFERKVVRTAESIEPGTRTLLTEVDVPNHNGALLPGGYAQAPLQVKVTGPQIAVPVNALLFRSEGLRAVVVDANHRAHLRSITVGRDYGTTLEVLQGLDVNDWIVLNPADSIDDGQEVRVKEVTTNRGPSQPAPQPNPAPGAKKQ